MRPLCHAVLLLCLIVTLCQSDITVTNISPASGPVAGNTLVTVTGSGFTTHNLQCSFGNTAVAGAFVTGELVYCLTPQASAAANAPFTIETSDGTSNAEPFVYFYQPLVLKLLPDSGPMAGGTLVTIIGGYFTDNPKLSCQFGVSTTSTVPATFTNSMSITCLTPEHAPGAATVQVTDDGNNWSDDSIAFNYEAVPHLSSLKPAEMPCNAPVVVTVEGNNFLQSSSLTCTLDGSSVPTTFIASTSITCKVEKVASPRTVSVMAANDGVTFSNALTLTYTKAEEHSSTGPFPSPLSLLPGGSTLLMVGLCLCGMVVCGGLLGGGSVVGTLVFVARKRGWLSSTSLSDLKDKIPPVLSKLPLVGNRGSQQQYYNSVSADEANLRYA
jgi:hypothetical protein